MRLFASLSVLGRYGAALLIVAGAVAMFGAARKSNFSTHDKAFYAAPAVIEYIQPGLVFNVVSANIASDGTVSVDYKITDPTGAPLDQSGVVTPGAVSPKFILDYMPKGQTQFKAYNFTTSTNATTGFVSTHPAADAGGTTKTVATGEYIYTFSAKAPSSYDPTLTHRIGVYGSRNLTQWDLGTAFADATLDFLPNGSKVTVTRDVVRTGACDKCHDQLAWHGGQRRDVQLCVMCHQPQMTDSNGNTADFPVMIHQIHIGSAYPDIQSSAPYALGSSNWTGVVMPSDVKRCTECHDSSFGATQANNWYTNPTRAACGGCHSNINFATGQNHLNLVEQDDNQCSTCHIKQGELPFDASVMGAHVMPAQAEGVPGMNFTLVNVANGGAGQKPTVTFTVKDNSGNPIPMSTITGNSGSLSLTMAGPTSDYGYTDFGVSTTPGYVTESATLAQCGSDGTCTYTLTHAVPPKATGTYAIGIEGRMSITLLPGTTQSTAVQYSGLNQVIYFSVDGSPIQKRRQVVALANCNKCHVDLELHGGLRNNTEYCVICHNPSNTDLTTRPTSVVAADQTLPNQAINFALMVHKIHTGANLQTQFNETYVIVGHGGSHNDFSTVLYPPFNNTGTPGDTTNCAMCHVNGSEANFPIGKNPVLDPQGLLSPMPATTAACTACHQNTSAYAHAVSQTDAKFGESCNVCHGSGAQFDVDAVHAGQ
ncbi:MAG TPA: OmcA/MtrC family decaheme c-type cytochrome [Bryobacteraceae bacterium]|nr:OmcA/MtrC family decaheme c-type cytochrome [Bryobacteraceae bacterium]